MGDGRPNPPSHQTYLCPLPRGSQQDRPKKKRKNRSSMFRLSPDRAAHHCAAASSSAPLLHRPGHADPAAVAAAAILAGGAPTRPPLHRQPRTRRCHLVLGRTAPIRTPTTPPRPPQTALTPSSRPRRRRRLVHGQTMPISLPQAQRHVDLGNA